MMSHSIGVKLKLNQLWAFACLNQWEIKGNRIKTMSAFSDKKNKC